MIHILTSTTTILKVGVRPQESRIGDSNVKAALSLKLKQTLTDESFIEQQGYLQSSAIAAYISLNKLDQHSRFRANVNLFACNNKAFNFTQGSSSSGLGFALACFDAWWRLKLNKNSHFEYPIFATGEVLTSGQINSIAQITEKIESVCNYVEENKDNIPKFYFCYPASNDEEIPTSLKERLLEINGQLIASNRLQETLGKLLGKHYDGDPLGRWVPFKGLSSFDYEDSVRFFGRDKDVERIYNDIEHNSGLLIVSGSSGTGKSSLIKAGLIPKLEKEYGSLFWTSCTPSALNPSQGILSFIFEQLIQAWDIPCQDVNEIIEIFNTSKNDGISLFQKFLTSQSINCLLYLDQYEEVFSQSEQGINVITNELSVIDLLAKSLSPLNIVLAVRNEYLGRLLDSQALRSPIISNVASQLTSKEWQSIVHEQALFSGIHFEQGDNDKQSLDQFIIEEAIQMQSALPMVSFLLEQLYIKALEEDSTSTLLLFKHYEELGGLSGAIACRASKVLKDNNPSDALISKFFDCFVGINPEGLPFARQVVLSEIEEKDQELYRLVGAFVNSNLVTNISNKEHKPIVKLAHDSLFNNWNKLKEWVENSKEYLLWRYSVDGSYARWQKALKNHNNYLIKDNQLLIEGKQYQKLLIIFDRKLDEYVTLSLKAKNQKNFTLLFIFIVLPVLAMGLYQWNKNRIKTHYYSAIGERWSVPFGINELTDEQVKHRTFSYRMDYQGGVLKRLAHVNSFNTFTIDESRNNASVWDYEYTADDKLNSEVIRDEKGKLVLINRYEFDSKNNGVLTFGSSIKNIGFLEDNQSFISQYQKDMVKKQNKTTISRVLIEYDNSGFIKRKTYQTPYGIKTSDRKKSFGKVYTYNEIGLIKTESNLDIDGKGISLNGVEKKQYTYDAMGNIKKESYFGKGGSLVSIEDGYASHVMEHDRWGNLTSGTFFGPNLSKQTHVEGFSSYSQLVDIKGSIKEVSFFDKNGELKERKQGVATIKYLYDERGNEIEQLYLGANGEKVLSKDDLGYSRGTAKYDVRNNIIENQYYGINDELIKVKGGYAQKTYQYDNHNKLLSIAYFDEQGKTTLNDNGVAKEKSSYNKNGEVIELSYLGIENEPILSKSGIHKMKLKYDKKGNVIEASYYNAINNPTTPADSCAINRFKYDARNNLIENSCFGIEGDKALNRFGCAVIQNKISENGSNESILCKGVYGEPLINKMGWHKEDSIYDNFGDFRGLKYFGTDLNPIDTKYNISSIDLTSQEFTFTNIQGREFKSKDFKLLKLIMENMSRGITNEKNSRLEGNDKYYSFEDNAQIKSLQGNSIFVDENNDYNILYLTSTESVPQVMIKEFRKCDLNKDVSEKLIKFNSVELTFLTMCKNTTDKRTMLVYTNMNKKINSLMVNELIEESEVTFSYDNRLLTFKTKGFVAEYIKHLLTYNSF